MVGDLGRWCGARKPSRRSAIERLARTRARSVGCTKKSSLSAVKDQKNLESLLWAVLSASAWTGRAIHALLAGPSICEHRAPADMRCGLGLGLSQHD